MSFSFLGGGNVAERMSLVEELEGRRLLADPFVDDEADAEPAPAPDPEPESVSSACTDPLGAFFLFLTAAPPAAAAAAAAADEPPLAFFPMGDMGPLPFAPDGPDEEDDDGIVIELLGIMMPVPGPPPPATWPANPAEAGPPGP